MKQKIDINKKYKTRSGLDVIVYTADRTGTFPVLADVIFDEADVCAHAFTSDGLFAINRTDDLDLIEVTDPTPVEQLRELFQQMKPIIDKL